MRLSICLLFLMTANAWAQDSSGVLQGTVSDDTDAVLPGVTVTLTNLGSNRVLSVSAGAYGNYSFRNVEPGRYSVVFELAGFSRTAYPEIHVLSAQTLRLDVLLKPGPVTTTSFTSVRVGTEKAASFSSSGLTVTMAATMSTLPPARAGYN